MKKEMVLKIQVAALILMAAICMMAQAAELKDFALYEAPAFVNADGTDKVIHEYEDVVIYQEPYGEIHTCVPVSDTTATELFNRNLYVPYDLVELFNKQGGKLHIVERPFDMNSHVNRTEIEGLCYRTLRDGRYVWDIDLYIMTGRMSLEYQIENACNNLSHELGHVLRLVTREAGMWTMEDEAIFNGIVKNKPDQVREMQNAPIELLIDEEIFAGLVAEIYGTPTPKTEHKDFVDHIISYGKKF